MKRQKHKKNGLKYQENAKKVNGINKIGLNLTKKQVKMISAFDKNRGKKW